MSSVLRLALLLIVAAVLALAARFTFLKSQAPAGPVNPEVMVRVSSSDLPAGLLLRNEDLHWQSMQESEVPRGAFVQGRGEDFTQGALLRQVVPADTVIKSSDIISASAPGFLAAALKPGMRAVSVQVDDVSGNAGLIQPGDYVDMILTQRVAGSTPGSPRQIVSETVVERTIVPYLAETDALINRIGVSSPTQVHLRVRVAEVSRSITQKLGINWAGIGGSGKYFAGIISGRSLGGIDIGAGGASAAGALLSGESSGGYSFLGGYAHGGKSIFGVLDVLEREGLVNVLAEPNLTAISGQTASFLAGGEFPVPTRQREDNTTVEFKPFGVALDFTPTVLGDDRISITVRPEISEIDPNSSIMMDGLVIPGVSVRRIETTVEMASGQSFAIGGLLQNNVKDVLSKLPGLGDLPILGRLFSSVDYQNNKSELVVIVTPYLVRPTDPDQLITPLDTMRANSDIEEVIRGQFDYDPVTGQVPRLSGHAGFVY